MRTMMLLAMLLGGCASPATFHVVHEAVLDDCAASGIALAMKEMAFPEPPSVLWFDNCGNITSSDFCATSDIRLDEKTVYVKVTYTSDDWGGGLIRGNFMPAMWDWKMLTADNPTNVDRETAIQSTENGWSCRYFKAAS